MPVQTSYPGVYIQELDSGVHSITGVATSITAFIGRAPRGPANHPVTVVSFADYVATFGGLWANSRMGYSVRDFFANGGSVAVIVRLFKPKAAADTGVVTFTLPKGATKDALTLSAVSPGDWGNNLMAAVRDQAFDPDGTPTNDRFNLQVFDSASGALEVHRNLSKDPADSRYVGSVLRDESLLVTLAEVKDTPANTPDPGDGLTIWTDDKAHFPNSTTKANPLGNDGAQLTKTEFTDTSKPRLGVNALDGTDLFNLLVIPPYTGTDDYNNECNVDPDTIAAAAKYCETRRAFLIVDAPATWKTTPVSDIASSVASGFSTVLGTSSANAAVYFPRLRMSNPLRPGQIEEYSSAGAVAGIYSATDANAGVWKAPAGLSTTISGVLDLTHNLVDLENGELNPLGLNCIRVKPPAGPVVWGARTLQGNDGLTSQWKYIPVRRFALFLEESLYRATQWVVFEPNSEPLWSEIRMNINAFMKDLFRQGAFQGVTPHDAYYVKCDSETTQQSDIDAGRVNIIVGFAPLKPAEFVVISLQQLAGQTAA